MVNDDRVGDQPRTNEPEKKFNVIRGWLPV